MLYNKLVNKTSHELENILKTYFGEIECIFYYPHNKWNVEFTKILSETSFKKIIYIDDMHTKNPNKANFSLCNNFDKILCSCSYKASELLPNIDMDKVISFPHYMCDHMFIYTKPNYFKKKILLKGSVSRKYPIRMFLSDLARQSYYIDDLSKQPLLHGIYYYKLTNSYVAQIATPGDIGYIVAKFFEIPASNTLLVAYDEHIKEELIKLGFIDNVNYISFNIKNYNERFSYILDHKNRHKIRTITNAGYNLIKDHHTLSNRVIQLNTIIKNLC